MDTRSPSSQAHQTSLEKVSPKAKLRDVLIGAVVKLTFASSPSTSPSLKAPTKIVQLLSKMKSDSGKT